MPFLRENIPSVLFWHFTDQFYHTDNDRIDKVSKTTLRNVGTAALISAYTLLNADENTAKLILSNLEKAAINRLNEELEQSKKALINGDSLTEQIEIITAWEDWYVKSANTTKDMVLDNSLFNSEIQKTQKALKTKAKSIKEAITKLQN